MAADERNRRLLSEKFFEASLRRRVLEVQSHLARLGKITSHFHSQCGRKRARAIAHHRGELPQDEEGELTLSWKDSDETPLALTIKGQIGSEIDRKVEVIRLESGTENQPIYTIAEDGEVEVEESSLSIIGWIKAGFLHILPKGLDHILFILGLFLLQPKLKPLLAQTSSFTIAHSITLGMVVLGVFTVPSKIVESMIALSIAYVGIENLWVKELKPWRIFFIFGLGLLHGMGFASVMQELDIPQ